MHTRLVAMGSGDGGAAAIEEAARIVSAGDLVVFPTETVYGIACLVRPDSLAKLDAAKGRTPDKRYTLHIGDKARLRNYVPRMPLKARKLVDRAWPGPVTMVFEVDASQLKEVRQSLSADVVEVLYRDGSIGVRCPDHPVATRLLEHISGPVVAPSANITGQAPPTDALGAKASLDGKVEMILDGGPCRYQASSTVVQVGPRGLEVLREGAISREALDRICRVQILFVCTGNTCRSAMAEGLCKKVLAENLGCRVDDLDKMGYTVRSAGTLNMVGAPASSGAVAASAKYGVDLRTHRSSGLTRSLVEASDWVFAMEQGHRQEVLDLCPASADRCLLLDTDEIPDPVGQPVDVFDQCARKIERAVKTRIGERVL